jgi:hypothetical protein
MSNKVTNDVSAISNYAGTYSKDLIGQLLNGLDIATDLFVIRNVKGAINLTKLTITKGVRPIDTSIDTVDAAGRVWSGRKLEVHGGMKIFEVVPEELRVTFMSEMLDPNATEVPFASWVWQQEFASVAEELNESLFYAEYHADAADFDPAVAYTVGTYVKFEKSFYVCLTATTAGQSPTTHAVKWDQRNNTVITTGPGTIIKNEITAGKLVPIATNAFTNTNTVAELQKVWFGAPVKFRNKKSIMRIAQDVFDKYCADYDTRYGKGNGIADDTEDRAVVYLKGSGKRCELRPVTYMSGSQRVILTLDKNLVMGTDQESALNQIGKMVPTLHGFKAIMKFLLGFEIQDLEILYVNDKL